jgi:hypothetical protein
VFSYERKTDMLTVATDGATPPNPTGETESVNDTTHLVHVYTPAWFAANFTDPTQIKLNFTVASTDATATSTLLDGSVAGASVSASGTVGDEFQSYSYVIGN